MIRTGTAYDMKPGQHNAKLTEVRAGMPAESFSAAIGTRSRL
jgi:hypothetical protein